MPEHLSIERFPELELQEPIGFTGRPPALDVEQSIEAYDSQVGGELSACAGPRRVQVPYWGYISWVRT